MFIKNISLSYPFAILKSIGKKTFENLGRILDKSGDTVSRILRPEDESILALKLICRSMFKESKTLYAIIDDTLIRKMFSVDIPGTGYFFDQQLGKRITAFKLVVGMISDGKHSIPIFSDYLFDKELLGFLNWKPKSKIEMAKLFVELVLKMFADKKIIVVADGLYSTQDFLKWCKHQNICVEMRMHSNRSVKYQGKKTTLNTTQSKRHSPKGPPDG